MIERFIAYMESERRLSPLTVDNYRRDIERFVAWWQERHTAVQFDVTVVEPADVREWIVHRMDVDKVKPVSMNRQLSSLKSLFRYLRKQGEINTDLFCKIISLRVPHNLPAFVSETRMERMLCNVRRESARSQFKEQRRALVVAMFYGCGLRLAELMQVKLSDIGDGVLRVRGKGDKERCIPLLPELEARIESYLQCALSEGVLSQRVGDTPLILSDKGVAWSRSSIQRTVVAHMREANIPGKKSAHILRHTFATHLLNRDADVRVIQELLGHSSLSTTQHYTHNSIAKLQSVYAKAHPHK